MEQTLIITLLVIILAELTYLVYKQAYSRLSVDKRTRQVFIDTSVLMDGRIITVAATGFLGGDTLVIPRSVIGELQLLADNADHDKRERARRGLDIVNQLQQESSVSVEIMPDSANAREGVDNRLLELAKRFDGTLCTIDYNLQKVATVEGVSVLNINELAQGLRMSYLPGERVTLDLQQKGQDNHQGVGYLPDGTMVVVEQASSLIGKNVEVEFIRALQTAAGRMMFAKLVVKKTSTSRREARRAIPSKPAAAQPAPQRPPKKQQKSSPRRDRESELIELMNS